MMLARTAFEVPESLSLCLFFFFNDTATTEIYTLSLTRRSSDLRRPKRVWGRSKIRAAGGDPDCDPARLVPAKGNRECSWHHRRCDCCDSAPGARGSHRPPLIWIADALHAADFHSDSFFLGDVQLFKPCHALPC